MRIDDAVRPFLRETLLAAAEDDADRFARSLQAYRDYQGRRIALGAAVAICYVVSLDVYGGPSPERVRDLAQTVAETAAWAGYPVETIETFLAGLFEVEPLERVLSGEDAFALTAIVAASMLSSWPRPDGQSWLGHLDEVETILAAMPMDMAAQASAMRLRLWLEGEVTSG